MTTDTENSLVGWENFCAKFAREHTASVRVGVFEIFALTRQRISVNGPSALDIFAGELFVGYHLLGLVESSAFGVARRIRDNFVVLADLVRKTAVEEECWAVAERAGKLYEHAVVSAPWFPDSAPTLTQMGDTLPSFVTSKYVRLKLLLVADQLSTSHYCLSEDLEASLGAPLEGAPERLRDAAGAVRQRDFLKLAKDAFTLAAPVAEDVGLANSAQFSAAAARAVDLLGLRS